jgi:hypothetical protein
MINKSLSRKQSKNLSQRINKSLSRKQSKNLSQRISMNLSQMINTNLNQRISTNLNQMINKSLSRKQSTNLSQRIRKILSQRIRKSLGIQAPWATSCGRRFRVAHFRGRRDGKVDRAPDDAPNAGLGGVMLSGLQRPEEDEGPLSDSGVLGEDPQASEAEINVAAGRPVAGNDALIEASAM